MGKRAAGAYLARWALLRESDAPAAQSGDTEETTEQVLARGQALRVDLSRLVALLLDKDDGDEAVVAAVVQAERDAGRSPPTPRGRAIQFQPRDYALLASLSTGRMLTAEALEWLHFPTWRARYRAHLDRSGDASSYCPAPDLYRRLAAMAAAGYVRTIARTSERARWAHQRLPGAYTLTEAGAELLVTQCGYERSELWAAESRARSLKNLEHTIAIGRCYAALRSAVEYVGGASLSEWRGDHLLDRPAAYDRLPIPRRRDPVPIQPDATCLLTTYTGTARLFVEIDQGTRPIVSWGEKALAYHAYRGSAALQARYGCDDFLLLVVVPTPGRRSRVAEVVVETTRQHTGCVLLLAEHIHPTTIRAYGQAVGSVEWVTQRVPQGVVTLPHLQWHSPPLWLPPPQQHPPADPPA